VWSTGRAFPELDPTEPAKSVPFQVGANKAKAQRREKRSRRGPFVALRRSRTLRLGVEQLAIPPGRITRSAG
jgi:hypothetical protein